MRKEETVRDMFFGYVIGVFITNVAWYMAVTLGWLK